jgi:hypothetical protein
MYRELDRRASVVGEQSVADVLLDAGVPEADVVELAAHDGPVGLDLAAVRGDFSETLARTALRLGLFEAIQPLRLSEEDLSVLVRQLQVVPVEKVVESTHGSSCGA